MTSLLLGCCLIENNQIIKKINKRQELFFVLYTYINIIILITKITIHSSRIWCVGLIYHFFHICILFLRHQRDLILLFPMLLLNLVQLHSLVHYCLYLFSWYCHRTGQCLCPCNYFSRDFCTSMRKGIRTWNLMLAKITPRCSPISFANWAIKPPTFPL